MKHTNVFSGITTCILALAGATISKAVKNPTTYPRYYCTFPQRTKCITELVACDNTGALTCTIKFFALEGTVTYTLYNINPIYAGHTGSPDGCKTADLRCLKAPGMLSTKSSE